MQTMNASCDGGNHEQRDQSMLDVKQIFRVERASKNIKVVVSHTARSDNFTVNSQIISQNGAFGYNLSELIDKALSKHNIDLCADVRVEYKSAVNGDIISYKATDLFAKRHLVKQEELVVKKGKSYLYLCFRNTTGNEIDFMKE